MAQMKLTEARIRALRPVDGKARLVFDTEAKGLLCTVQKSGNVTFAFRYWINGRRRQIAVGYASAVLLRDARDTARAYAGEVARGIDPLEAKAKAVDEGKHTTIAQLWKDHSERQAKRWKPQTARENERLYRTEIAPVFGRRKVSEVSRAQVRHWHEGYANDRPIIGNRAKAVLSGIIRHAIDAERFAGPNPCHGVQPHKEQARSRRFSSQELARIGKALAVEAERKPERGTGVRGRDAVDAIMLLALTGCRRSEVLALRWREVDFDHHFLRIEATKTAENVVKCFGNDVEAILRRRREEDPTGEFVFPSHRGGGPLRDIRESISRMFTAAGIAHRVRKPKRSENGTPDVDPKELATLHHVWTHTYTTEGEGFGIPDAHLAYMTFHSARTQTQRYGHLGPNDVRASEEKLQAHLARALRGELATVIPLRSDRSSI